MAVAAPLGVHDRTGLAAVGALAAVASRAFTGVGDVAQAAFALIHDLFGFRACVLSRLDLDEDTLTVVEFLDRAGLGIVKGAVVPAHEGPCDFVVRSARALRHPNLDEHPVFSRLPMYSRAGVRSYVGVPLRRSDGTVWGTLATVDTERRETTDAQLEVLAVLARLIAFEVDRDEQREAVAAHARMREERCAMAAALEEERARGARLRATLETAARVSHEVNNPLTVLQLRLGRLAKRFDGEEPDTFEDLETALEAADAIHQVTMHLRQVVRPLGAPAGVGQGHKSEPDALVAPGAAARSRG